MTFILLREMLAWASKEAQNNNHNSEYRSALKALADALERVIPFH